MYLKIEIQLELNSLHHSLISNKVVSRAIFLIFEMASNNLSSFQFPRLTKEKFVELDESVNGNVSFGDSSKVQIRGKGTILISSNDGSHILISNVYYMP